VSEKYFIDTNVVVYAYDSHDPRKQRTAQRILTEALAEERGVLSVQVIGEFFTAVTRRIPVPLSVDEAGAIIDILCVMPVQEVDASMVRRAIETGKIYGLSYWDSLIIAAAERAGCSRLVSEDMNDGQRYHSVVVENPFAV
jgi:predicted nucleic acid-binding protein